MGNRRPNFNGVYSISSNASACEADQASASLVRHPNLVVIETITSSCNSMFSHHFYMGLKGNIVICKSMKFERKLPPHIN